MKNYRLLYVLTVVLAILLANTIALVYVSFDAYTLGNQVQEKLDQCEEDILDVYECEVFQIRVRPSKVKKP